METISKFEEKFIVTHGNYYSNVAPSKNAGKGYVTNVSAKYNIEELLVECLECDKDVEPRVTPVIGGFRISCTRGCTSTSNLSQKDLLKLIDATKTP
ncbi:hypothetical protein DZA50_06630 [Kangiella sp. HD9-110m-PIT-SAG07]|nr:hypothetical protein DZA50_06630 [Kangiella sp. HD9-110m-PIT-SAG07]